MIVYSRCCYFCSFTVNDLLEESIHLFINIIAFPSIICRKVNFRKKKSGISCHRNDKTKELKTIHLPIPQYVVTETMPPHPQAAHIKQSIQRKPSLSNRKRKSLRENNDKIQTQTKVILAANTIITDDAWKDKKISNDPIQAARYESSSEKKASNAIIQDHQEEDIA